MPQYNIEILVTTPGAQKAAAAVRGVGKASDKASRDVQKLTFSFGKLKAAIGGLGLLYLTRRIYGVGKATVDVAADFERLGNKMRFAMGGTSAAAEAMKFVADETERLGRNFRKGADSFGTLQAAMKDVEGTKELFSAILEASTALGLGMEDTNATFRAFVQIASKGKLQAEELVGQLGERLPGAYEMAAEAMGVTRKELNKMLEQGEVMADEFLPRFAKKLREVFGEAATNNSDSFISNMNRVRNSLEKVQNQLGTAMMPAVSSFAKAIVAAGNNLDMVAGILATLAATQLPRAIAGVQSLTTAVRGLNVALLANPFGAVAVAITAIGAALVVVTKRFGEAEQAATDFMTTGVSGAERAIVNLKDAMGQGFIEREVMEDAQSQLAELNARIGEAAGKGKEAAEVWQTMRQTLARLITQAGASVPIVDDVISVSSDQGKKIEERGADWGKKFWEGFIREMESFAREANEWQEFLDSLSEGIAAAIEEGLEDAFATLDALPLPSKSDRDRVTGNAQWANDFGNEWRQDALWADGQVKERLAEDTKEADKALERLRRTMQNLATTTMSVEEQIVYLGKSLYDAQKAAGGLGKMSREAWEEVAEGFASAMASMIAASGGDQGSRTLSYGGASVNAQRGGNMADKGAAIGGMFGPWGAVAGAVIGSAIQLPKSMSGIHAEWDAVNKKYTQTVRHATDDMVEFTETLMVEISENLDELLKQFGLTAVAMQDFELEIGAAGVAIWQNDKLIEGFEEIGDAIDFLLTTLLKTGEFEGHAETLAALQNSNAETIAELIDDLNFADWVRKLGMTDLEVALEQIALDFAEATERAIALGLPLENIVAYFENLKEEAIAADAEAKKPKGGKGGGHKARRDAVWKEIFGTNEETLDQWFARLSAEIDKVFRSAEDNAKAHEALREAYDAAARSAREAADAQAQIDEMNLWEQIGSAIDQWAQSTEDQATAQSFLTMAAEMRWQLEMANMLMQIDMLEKAGYLTEAMAQAMREGIALADDLRQKFDPNYNPITQDGDDPGDPSLPGGLGQPHDVDSLRRFWEEVMSLADQTYSSIADAESAIASLIAQGQELGHSIEDILSAMADQLPLIAEQLTELIVGPIRALQQEILGSSDNPFTANSNFDQLRTQFREMAAAALGGDQDAIQSIPALARQLLSAGGQVLGGGGQAMLEQQILQLLDALGQGEVVSNGDGTFSFGGTSMRTQFEGALEASNVHLFSIENEIKGLREDLRRIELRRVS